MMIPKLDATSGSLIKTMRIWEQMIPSTPVLHGGNEFLNHDVGYVASTEADLAAQRSYLPRVNKSRK
jgi:hypothetical protein